jgi:Protein of unknown function (DUF551)
MWINKADDLPSENEYVLVHPPYITTVFECEPRHVLQWYRGNFQYFLGGSVHNAIWRDITHWMPLPTPPTADNAEGANLQPLTGQVQH